MMITDQDISRETVQYNLDWEVVCEKQLHNPVRPYSKEMRVEQPECE